MNTYIIDTIDLPGSTVYIVTPTEDQIVFSALKHSKEKSFLSILRALRYQ